MCIRDSKSILEFPGYKKEVNPEALDQYLSYQYSVLPETFFKGIYKLMPGHYLKYKDGQMETYQYWNPMLHPEKKQKAGEIQAEMKRSLEDSIKAVSYTHLDVYKRQLLGCMYIAVGLLMSSLTESPVIAAVSTFGILLVCYLWEGLQDFMPASAVTNLLVLLTAAAAVGAWIWKATKNWILGAGAGTAGMAVCGIVFLTDSGK